MPKKYHVEVVPSADRDIRAAEAYIARDKPGAAAKWVLKVNRKIRSLATMPLRCERVPEAEGLGLDYRQLLFGNCRIILRVEGDTVLVLRVYHAARLFELRIFDPSPQDN